MVIKRKMNLQWFLKSLKHIHLVESNGDFGKVELLGAMLHTGNTAIKRNYYLGRKWGKLNEDGSLNTTALGCVCRTYD